MAEEKSHPETAGSVTEETARLLSALGGWASGIRPEDAAPSHGCPNCATSIPIGQAGACSVCPLCRGIALVQAVRPETIERLADFASLIATSLRDLASSVPPSAAASSRPGSSRTQDIPVDDDDAEEAQP